MMIADAKQFLLDHTSLEPVLDAIRPHESTLLAFSLIFVCLFVTYKRNDAVVACCERLLRWLDPSPLLKYRVTWFMGQDMDLEAIQENFQRHWDSGTIQSTPFVTLDTWS